MKNSRLHLNIRLGILGLIFLGLFAYLIYGLYDLSVTHYAAYQAATASTSVVTTYQSGSRGTITDCSGKVLAYDETCYDVMFYRDPDKTSAVDSARYTQSLMEAIRIIEEGGGVVENSFYILMNNDGTYYYDFGVTSETAIASRKKNFVEACRFSNPDLTAEEAYLILRESWQIPDDMEFEQAAKIMSIRQEAVLNSWHAYEGVVVARNVSLSVVTELDMLQSELVGIETRMSGSRVYPYKEVAGQVVGYMQKQVTTNMEDIGFSFEKDFSEFSDREDTNNLLELGYSYSDKIGVAGVEKSCEGYLSAHLTERQGTRVIEKTRTGSVVEVLSTTAAAGGKNVQLSLDIELQKVCEDALAENIAVTNEKQLEKIQDSYSKYEKLRANPEESIQRAETGAIVVMEVNTGKVLAMASSPGYDPNMFTDGIDSEELELLFGDNSNQPTLNRTIAIRTAPGSIFKMATGFAGLMEGAITADTRISDRSPYYYFYNDPTTKVEANAPSCWVGNTNRHANLDLAHALAVSCNYYFFTVSDRVGIERLDYWAGQLGLSGTTGVELPGELSVQVGGQSVRYDNTKTLSQQSSAIPRLIYNQIAAHLRVILEEAGKEATYEELTHCAQRLLELQDGTQTEHGEDIRRILYEELNIPMGISLLHTNWVVQISVWLEELRWKPTYTIQSGIGQGVMLLTPLSVARYISTIANRGTAYKASILDSIYNSDGTLYQTVEPEIDHVVEAPDEYWDILYEGMADVVSAEEGGTAAASFSRDFRDTYLKRMVGKTGTAQTATTSATNIDIENTAWFVAVYPKEDPQIAMVVYIPNGLSGSSNAVAVERVATWWFENRYTEPEPTAAPLLTREPGLVPEKQTATPEPAATPEP